MVKLYNTYIATFCFYSFLAIFILCNVLWICFDPFNCGFQYSFIIQFFNLYISFGIDGISIFFIYLSAFLITLCILFAQNARTNSIEKNNFIILLFMIGVLLLLVFMVLDLFFFYIAFEAILVPFFIYIGVSGYRTRRIHAAYLFFFYTIVGSYFMLLSIFFIYLHVGSTAIEYLWFSLFGKERAMLIWIAFFFAFAIKIPMFPFHVWLPEAHVEAPTEGSVLLAGLLLKLGTYGFLRFLFPIFPEHSIYFAPLVLLVASLGIIYTSFTTLRQIDIKRVIAYSSVAHMNMCVVGLFSFNELAFAGSIFLMIAHGIVSGGLFMMIGIIYNRYRTKTLYYYSGVVHTMPVFSFFFMLTLGNIGMPGTSNFIGELLIICGVMYINSYFCLFAASTGIFLCTIYSMWLYNKMIFMLPKFKYTIFSDMYLFEIIIMLPIIYLMLYIGLFPNTILLVLEYAVYYNYLVFFL